MSCVRCGAGNQPGPKNPNARPGGYVPRPESPNQMAVDQAVRNAIAGLKYVPNSIGPAGCSQR